MTSSQENSKPFTTSWVRILYSACILLLSSFFATINISNKLDLISKFMYTYVSYIQTYVHSAKNDTIIIMVMKYDCNDYAN